MKTMKKAALLLCASICMFLGTRMSVYADDVSVDCILVKDEDDLRNYINSKGNPTSSDHTSPDSFGEDVYGFTIEEEGELIIYALSTYETGRSATEYTKLQLYSDYALKSELLQMNAQENVFEEAVHLQVSPGTYYYRIYQKHDGWAIEDMDSDTNTYIGFAPAAGVSEKDIAARTYMDVNNEKVNPIVVESEEDLATYINQNGIPTSRSHTIPGGFGDTYCFTVEEPGELIIYCLSAQITGEEMEDIGLRVYSDCDLKSQLLMTQPQENTFIEAAHLEIAPGTYYYRLHQAIGGFSTDKECDSNVFLGFVPADEVPEESKDERNYIEDNCEEIVPITVKTGSELADYINQNGTPSSETITAPGEFSDTYKFTLEEDGELYVYCLSKMENGNMAGWYTLRLRIYSDIELKSHIFGVHPQENTSEEAAHFPIAHGTYYFRARTAGDSYNACDSQIYIGFRPYSDIISVAGMQKNEDGTTGIDFNVAQEYEGGQIRIEQGIIPVKENNNSELWKEDTRENGIPGTHADLAEAGVYTARITKNDLVPATVVFDVGGQGEISDDQNSNLETESREISEETESPSEIIEQVETEVEVVVSENDNDDLEEENRKLREEIEYLTQIIEQAGIDVETIAD